MDKALKIDMLQGLIYGYKERLMHMSELEDFDDEDKDKIVDKYFYAMREIFFNENLT